MNNVIRHRIPWWLEACELICAAAGRVLDAMAAVDDREWQTTRQAAGGW